MKTRTNNDPLENEEKSAIVKTSSQGGRNLLLILLKFADKNFIWVILILIIIGASFVNPRFVRFPNLMAALVAVTYLGCLTLAQTLVLISGHFDLTTEANMIFSAVVGGLLATPSFQTKLGNIVHQGGGFGLPWQVALAAMLIVAAFIGLLNGLMVVKLRMNAFMVTLAMSIMLGGAAIAVAQSRQFTSIPEGLRYVGEARIGPIPMSVVFVVVLMIVAYFVLSRTVYGRQLYSVGSNRKAARAAGINDDLIIISAFILSGLLSGMAGYVLIGRLGVASAGMSSGALFVSMASAVIGGVSISGGRGTVQGMIGGILVMGVLTNALNLAQIPSEYVRVVYGAVILIAVFIDTLRDRRRISA